MTLLADNLVRGMMPNAGTRLTPHMPYIAPALEKAAIDTPLRIAAFMAQVAHESGEYRYLEEVWGPTEAQRGYEGRQDLGNVVPGDGEKYKGHGPIQVTGRVNHMLCGQALKLDLVNYPRLLCLPQNATASACWFWNSRKLSKLADRGWFRAITRAINGGYNGWTDRLQYYQRNRELLGLDPYEGLLQEDVDVRKFQRDHGLTADGVVGPMTMAKL